MASMLSAFRSGQKSGRRLSKGQKRAIAVGGVAVGAAAVGGLVYYLANKKAGGSTGPNPSSAIVTAAPGAMSASVSPNGTVTVNLPTGASWDVQFSAFPGGLSGTASGGIGTDPLVLQGLSGNGTIPLEWSDTNNQSQTTSLTLVAA